MDKSTAGKWHISCLPWLAFSTLGAIIAESENDLETRKNIMAIGAFLFLISIIFSFLLKSLGR